MFRGEHKNPSGSLSGDSKALEKLLSREGATISSVPTKKNPFKKLDVQTLLQKFNTGMVELFKSAIRFPKQKDQFLEVIQLAYALTQKNHEGPAKKLIEKIFEAEKTNQIEKNDTLSHLKMNGLLDYLFN